MKYLQTLLITLSLFFVSCIYEETASLKEDETTNVTYKELDINIDTGFSAAETKAGEGGDANVICAAEVKIERVRLYYFNGTTYLSNKLFTVSSTTGTASFTALVPDISTLRIIAIVNEPTSMSSTLSALKTRATILQANYTLSNYMTKYVYTRNSTSWGFTSLPFFGEVASINATTAKSISMPVTRSVARVDVYFSTPSTLPSTVKLTAANTTFAVSNASSKGAFSNLAAVTLVPTSFTADKLTADLALTTSGQRVYYYYMAPIYTNIVNPTMTINNILYSDFQYSKNFTVNNFINSAIKANNIYRIYLTITEGNMSMNVSIVKWTTSDKNITL